MLQLTISPKEALLTPHPWLKDFLQFKRLRCQVMRLAYLIRPSIPSSLVP
jgi:hypothetical protein